MIRKRFSVKMGVTEEIKMGIQLKNKPFKID